MMLDWHPFKTTHTLIRRFSFLTPTETRFKERSYAETPTRRYADTFTRRHADTDVVDERVLLSHFPGSN
jgi:hypothetical protein